MSSTLHYSAVENLNSTLYDKLARVTKKKDGILTDTTRVRNGLLSSAARSLGAGEGASGVFGGEGTTLFT